MPVKQAGKYWITAAVAFAIVWSLLVYAVHTHPASQADGHDTVCTVCADMHRDSAPPALPRLLPPVAAVLVPYSADVVSVAGAPILPAYRSRGPPTV